MGLESGGVYPFKTEEPLEVAVKVLDEMIRTYSINIDELVERLEKKEASNAGNRKE